MAVPAALLVGALLDRLVAATPRALLVVGGFAGLVAVIALRELVAAPWEWIDLFTYHYKGYKPEYYFPVESLDTIELLPAAGDRKAVAVSLFAVIPGVAGGLALLLPLALTLRALARGAVDAVPGRSFVTGAVVGAVVCAVFAVQGFMARASQHWSQRWLLATYHELREADEPLIAYQMDWKGETFYGKNTEFQVKKNVADLRMAVDRPGREYVLVQTDRLEGLKTALRGGESRITVVDKSNAKWLLVTVD
jgi:hypothetical protein